MFQISGLLLERDLLIFSFYFLLRLSDSNAKLSAALKNVLRFELCVIESNDTMSPQNIHLFFGILFLEWRRAAYKSGLRPQNQHQSGKNLVHYENFCIFIAYFDRGTAFGPLGPDESRFDRPGESKTAATEDHLCSAAWIHEGRQQLIHTGRPK